MRSVCVKLALIIAKIEMDSSVSALQKYICPFFWGVQLTNAMPEFIHFIFGLPHLFSLQLKIVCVLCACQYSVRSYYFSNYKSWAAAADATKMPLHNFKHI